MDSIRSIILEVDVGTYALHDAEGNKRINIPGAGLRTLLNNRARILNDLTRENLPRTVYWNINDIIIFSITLQLDDEPNYSTVLCIEKANNIEVTLDRANAELMLLIIKMIRQCQQQRENRGYDGWINLTTSKSFSSNWSNNTCTIRDEQYNREVTTSFAAIASLWQQFVDIQNRLQNEDDYNDALYWADNNHRILGRRCPNHGKNTHYNALVFLADQRVTIREKTFIEILQHCVGELPIELPDPLNGAQVTNNLLNNKNFQYPIGEDFENFEIRNEHRESFTLPTTALDAVRAKRNQIIEFLDGEEKQKYIWSNESFFIKTQIFENIHGGSEERVLAFIKKSGNKFVFSIKEDNLTMMLDMYEKSRRNRQ